VSEISTTVCHVPTCTYYTLFASRLSTLSSRLMLARHIDVQYALYFALLLCALQKSWTCTCLIEHAACKLCTCASASASICLYIIAHVPPWTASTAITQLSVAAQLEVLITCMCTVPSTVPTIRAWGVRAWESLGRVCVVCTYLL
jgi:hypothetical protein